MTVPNRNTKEYSKLELVFGIAIIVLWISLGAISFGLFYPLAALGYSALLAFLVFFEMGKHGCVTCYYCKTCTIGMGKLPEFFFKQKGTANVNRKAQRLFPFVYALLSLVPVLVVGFSIYQEPVAYKVVLLSAILAFSLYVGLIRHKILLP